MHENQIIDQNCYHLIKALSCSWHSQYHISFQSLFLPVASGALADSLQVLAIVADEKGLLTGRRPKAIMYIEDVAEFARVLLTTIETTFTLN
jgi:hypothetical protein